MTTMAVDKSESRVRRMFAEIAPRYDFLNHLLSFGVDRYWRWQTVRRVPIRGDAPMLDLCTGTGDLALAYARHLSPTGRIVGSDFCHEMLAIGRTKGARAGHNGRLTFVEADAQRLPFPDDMFQIVCVAFGLRNITNTDLGLREMVRVCQPCGAWRCWNFRCRGGNRCGDYIVSFSGGCCPRWGKRFRTVRRRPTIICRKAWANFPTAKRWQPACKRPVYEMWNFGL